MLIARYSAFFPVGKKIWVLEWIAELTLDLTCPRAVGGGGNFVLQNCRSDWYVITAGSKDLT